MPSLHCAVVDTSPTPSTAEANAHLVDLTQRGALGFWQSELLAVGSFAVLAVYPRQRGSPESKPVGAPHANTGIGG